MKNYIVAIALAFSVALSGCTAFKISLAEYFVNKVVTGKWEKEGAVPGEYYTSNWECQRDNSNWDPNLGVVFDLKEYYNCMISRGWTLRPYKASDLQ